MTVIALNTANFIAIAQTMLTILSWKGFHARPLKSCRKKNLTTTQLRSFATHTVILQTFLVILLATKQIVCSDFVIWSRLICTTTTFTNFGEERDIINLSSFIMNLHHLIVCFFVPFYVWICIHSLLRIVLFSWPPRKHHQLHQENNNFVLSKVFGFFIGWKKLDAHYFMFNSCNYNSNN